MISKGGGPVSYFTYQNECYHQGIKGQKWGIRNGPPYPLNRNGTVFISGSWRTSEPGSPYQRSRLPHQVTDRIDEYIRDKKQIIVGEAPGVDRQVQDYLNSRNYSNVVVFGVDSGARYVANPNWRVRLISSNAPRGSSEWLAAKDVAMSNEATEGLTVVLDNGGAGATRNNAARLMRDGKPVSVFRLSSDGANMDSFVNERDEIVMHSDELYHHGIKGQKWGVRRYQDKSGKLTPEGRVRAADRNRASSAFKTKPLVDEIISSMSKEEKAKLGLHESGDYLTREDGASVIKRVVLKNGDTPVSFFDVFDDGDHYNLAVGTRSGEEYRRRGYATEAARRGMEYYERNRERLGNKPVVWGVRVDNDASIRIAESLGFERDETSYSDDGRWVNYTRR